jgi:hypothetical protein
MQIARFRLVSLAMAILLASLLEGCSITRDNLIGKYRARFKDGIEDLDLRKDGTYVQVVKLTEGTRVENTGAWKYSEEFGAISLVNPIIVDDIYGKRRPDWQLPQEGLWVIEADRFFTQITLDWSDDLGYVFRRI